VKNLLTRNYYRTLGLRSDASAEEIKKVYRRLALKYHPDSNGGNHDSEERLKEINEAYHILGDKEKRRHYDLQYRQDSESSAFYKGGMDGDLISVLRVFSQMGFDTMRSRGCKRRGFGRGGCGRWRKFHL
jgi:DnaJ-class molecular chaperone